MRIGVIGDIHSSPVHPGPGPDLLDLVLARLVRARDEEPEGLAGVLLVGDVACGLGRVRWPPPPLIARYLSELAAVLERVRALDRPVYWVPGNHDLREFPRRWTSTTSWRPAYDVPYAPVTEGPFRGNIDGKLARIGDVTVFGIGGSGPAQMGFTYEWAEDEIRARPAPPPGVEILLCHCPPIHTPIDLTVSREHVGSMAIRELASRHAGVLLCGHIHEAAGVSVLGRCVCVNAGALGEPYPLEQVVFLERRAPYRFAIVQENLREGTTTRWDPDRGALTP